MQILPLPNVTFFWNLFRAHAHWRALQASSCTWSIFPEMRIFKTIELIFCIARLVDQKLGGFILLSDRGGVPHV